MRNPSIIPPLLAESVSSPRILTYKARHEPRIMKVNAKVITANTAGGTCSVKTPCFSETEFDSNFFVRIRVRYNQGDVASDSLKTCDLPRSPMPMGTEMAQDLVKNLRADGTLAVASLVYAPSKGDARSHVTMNGAAVWMTPKSKERSP